MHYRPQYGDYGVIAYPLVNVLSTRPWVSKYVVKSLRLILSSFPMHAFANLLIVESGPQSLLFQTSLVFLFCMFCVSAGGFPLLIN